MQGSQKLHFPSCSALLAFSESAVPADTSLLRMCDVDWNGLSTYMGMRFVLLPVLSNAAPP